MIIITAAQTRIDTIAECAELLDHLALGFDDDYQAAPYLRGADAIRHLAPQQHTALGPVFLASHGISVEKMRLVDDMLDHADWSVAHFLTWMHEQGEL